MDSVSVLIITGTLGSGKSSVADEIFERLSAADVAHAFIDFDAFGSRWPRDATTTDIEFRNLAAVWRNYADAGIRRAVIAHRLEAASQLEQFRAAIPGAEIVVARLEVSVGTLEDRLRRRELGSDLESHLAWAREHALASRAVDAADVVVRNDGGVTIPEVATQLLRVMRWLGGRTSENTSR